MVALGVPLGVSTYPLPSGRDKIVYYWAAEVAEKAIASSTFVPNGEIAAIEWGRSRRPRLPHLRARRRDPRRFATLPTKDHLARSPSSPCATARRCPRDWEARAPRPAHERGVKQARRRADASRAWRPTHRDAATPCAASRPSRPARRDRASSRREAGISQDAYERAAAMSEGRRRRLRPAGDRVLCQPTDPVLPLNSGSTRFVRATGTPDSESFSWGRLRWLYRRVRGAARADRTTRRPAWSRSRSTGPPP